MTDVEMKKFGATLTDRADGKKAVDDILRKHSPPIRLDFSGVVALGSSFGDEVVLVIAQLQDGTIHIVHANNVIQHSLFRTVEGTAVNLVFDR